MSIDEVSAKHVERGYQRPVVHPGWAFAAFGAVVLMVFLVLGVVWLIQERLYGGHLTSLSAVEDVADTIPAPRLQSSPARDLVILQARAAALLNGYGWIDRSQGIVHIPIDRAMTLVLERGLDQPFHNSASQVRGGMDSASENHSSSQPTEKSETPTGQKESEPGGTGRATKNQAGSPASEPAPGKTEPPPAARSADQGVLQRMPKEPAAQWSADQDQEGAAERAVGAGARPPQQSTVDTATSKARAANPPPDRPALPTRQGLEPLVEPISPEEAGAIHAPQQKPAVDKEQPPSLGGPWPLPGERAPP